MTRQRLSFFLLTLTLGATAAVATACGEGDSGQAGVAESGTRRIAANNGTTAGGGSDTPYQVSCSNDGCVAGTDVVVGYDIYGKNCHRCHGADALGSTFAPPLIGRLKDMNKGEFIAVVTDGKTVFDSTTGGYRVMPSWKGSQDVMNHIDQLWAYLKARSDGALKAVRPTPMK